MYTIKNGKLVQRLRDRKFIKQVRDMTEPKSNIDKPGLYHSIIAHDDWCRTLKTGRGSDCNCNPSTELRRHVPRKEQH